jgi:hypothetical protein
MSTACPACGESKTATHRTPDHGASPGPGNSQRFPASATASIAAWPTARWSGVLRLPPGHAARWFPGDHELGAVPADRMRDVAAQRRAVLDRPVGVVEELHSLHTDDLGCRPLLGLAQRPTLRRRDRVDAGLTARHQQVDNGASLRGPAGDSAGGPVLEVVRVGDDCDQSSGSGLYGVGTGRS